MYREAMGKSIMQIDFVVSLDVAIYTNKGTYFTRGRIVCKLKVVANKFKIVKSILG